MVDDTNAELQIQEEELGARSAVGLEEGNSDLASSIAPESSVSIRPSTNSITLSIYVHNVRWSHHRVMKVHPIQTRFPNDRHLSRIWLFQSKKPKIYFRDAFDNQRHLNMYHSMQKY